MTLPSFWSFLRDDGQGFSLGFEPIGINLHSLLCLTDHLFPEVTGEFHRRLASLVLGKTRCAGLGGGRLCTLVQLLDSG